MPERYGTWQSICGTWQSIYGLFRRWQLAGTWAAILTGLQAMAAKAGLIEWVVSVDTTINRAHQHAAGARSQPEDQAEPPVGDGVDPLAWTLGRRVLYRRDDLHAWIDARRDQGAAERNPAPMVQVDVGVEPRTLVPGPRPREAGRASTRTEASYRRATRPEG